MNVVIAAGFSAGARVRRPRYILRVVIRQTTRAATTTMHVIAPAGSRMGASGSRSHIFRGVVRHGPLPAVRVVSAGRIIVRACRAVSPNAGRDGVGKVWPAARSAAVMYVIAPRWVGVGSRDVGGANRFDVAGSKPDSVNVVFPACESACADIGSVASILRLLTAKCQPDVYVVFPAAG